MTDPHNYGKKQPEASGYAGIPAGPDVWTWKGYKDFGWHRYRPQVSSLFCTFIAGAFFCGLLVGSILIFEILKNRIQ